MVTLGSSVGLDRPDMRCLLAIAALSIPTDDKDSVSNICKDRQAATWVGSAGKDGMPDFSQNLCHLT